jgi:hypothetical protein
LSLIGTSNPHFVQFDLLGEQKMENGKYLYKVKIYEGLTDKDRRIVGYFDETLTVIKSGGEVFNRFS